MDIEHYLRNTSGQTCELDARSMRNEHDLVRLLNEHGVMPTMQRLDIARVLLAEAQHVSAEQLLVKVNAAGGNVSKATIYNTLRLFTARGLVREVIVDPERVFYDSTTRPHHHFYDLDSGELIDIPHEHVTFRRLPELPDGSEHAGVDVIVKIRKARA